MQTATETKHILNDLILINNDRIAGYEKAIGELKSKDGTAAENIDLVVLFERMIDESRHNRNALRGIQHFFGNGAIGRIHQLLQIVPCISQPLDNLRLLTVNGFARGGWLDFRRTQRPQVHSRVRY